MSLEIRRVSTRRDLKKYVRFPLELYKKNPHFIPPILMDEKAVLSPRKNPSFESAEAASWLALENGNVVGRITAIYLPRYKEFWGRNTARFGWVDFIDDPRVSSLLFSTAEAWAGTKGAVSISGPQGFTDLDPEGMLIEGFDETGTLPMIYNYPYYQSHLASLGYRKDTDWVEFELKIPEKVPEKVVRVAALFQEKSGFRVLEAKSARDYIPYGKGIFEVLEEAYGHLYGFMPLAERQVEGYIKQYISFIDPRFTKLILDRNDRVMAFGITMPSFSRALQKNRGRMLPLGWLDMLRAMQHPSALDLYLIGVRKKLRNTGAAAMVIGSIMQEAIDAGIKTAESSGNLEDNIAVQSLWNLLEHRQHKRRRCFIKEL